MLLSQRALVISAASFAIFVLALGGDDRAAAAATPKLSAPKTVKPGKKTFLRATGFPRRSRVAISLQPTAYRGGNGFGIAVHRRFRLSKQGRGWIKFRMPARYYACAGVSNCSARKWRKRSRVDINVCTVNKKVPRCATAVSRIR
jgi:hypothetical protein